jgi:hypothetical protein
LDSWGTASLLIFQKNQEDFTGKLAEVCKKKKAIV